MLRGQYQRDRPGSLPGRIPLARARVAEPSAILPSQEDLLLHNQFRYMQVIDRRKRMKHIRGPPAMGWRPKTLGEAWSP